MANDTLPSVATQPSRRGPLAAMRNAVIFLLALGASSAVLTAFAPFPNLGNLWRKYHHLREHGDRYSVIYLGSSRVFHEFIPEQFDEELAKRGFQARSFNFGQDGMWPPESFYMLREILTLRPANLRWVLVDLMGIKAELEGNETTLRAVHWHDLYHACVACRHAVEVDMEGQRSFGEKADLCWRHVNLWAQRSTGLGQGHEQLELVLKLQRKKNPAPVLDGGFERAGSGPLTGGMRAMFDQSVARLKRNPPGKPIQPVLREALERVIAEVRAAGAEPVFVVAAGIYGAERFSDWPPAGVHVLRFDDPNRFPDLYDPAERYDPHHLDTEGARKFTRHLAEQFSMVLERKP